MVIITKNDVKILNSVYRHRKNGVTFAYLSGKFSSERVYQLINANYLSCTRETKKTIGIPCDLITEKSIVSLSDLGLAEVESHQWFDVKYFLTQIVLPILIGVISSILTAILLRLI